MAQVINTNILSLNAQRNLNSTSSALQTSLQRLSSGLRINSAKDDAAGLAISERFSTQIRGLNQAVRNANDGISLAQTAEGALAEVSNNLQRIRELAVQARNATNSASDRAALDAEVQQRISEIGRVASQTEFNGLKLLDGSFTDQIFQVGANFGQTISVSSIASATKAALGLDGGTLETTVANVTGGTLTGAVTNGALTINGNNIGAVARDASAIALAINTLAPGVTATATASTSGSLGAFTTTVGGTYSLTIEGVNVISAGAAGVDGGAVDTALGTNAAALTAAGVTVQGTAAGGNLTLSKADGSTLDITEAWGAGASAGGFAALTDPTAGNSVDTAYYGTVNLTSENAIEIAGTAPGLAGFTTGTNAVTTTTENYTAINVLTADAADTVLRVVDSALDGVNGSRASLGAVQNRFESVIANLSTVSENLTSSRSRILDADFAAETAALTRAQILQQAGISVLSQANAAPQSVLSLLR